MDEIIRAIKSGSDLPKAVEEALALSTGEQEELLQQIGRIKSENAGQFLGLLYPRLSDKKLQKLVKKDLFRLKTLGVAVEEPKAQGESVLRNVESTKEAMGLVSNYDAALTRVVLTAVELRKNHFLFAHSILHFTTGLMELRSFNVNRIQLEELARDYVARTKSPMVLASASPPYAGYLVEEASGISGKEKDDARSLNRMLGATRGDARKPADIYHLEVDPSVSPASAEAVLDDEIFQPFLPQWRGIEDDQKALKAVTNPAIVLPSSVIGERKAVFFSDLMKKDHVRTIMRRFKRMLEDTAYLFYCLKEQTLYAGLVLLLEDQKGIENAFVRFVEKVFNEMEKAAEEQKQPGVIVDPYSLIKR